MIVQRVAGMTAIAVVVLAGWGCASGPKLPKYRPPALAKSEAAMLNGYGATYIAVADNQSVPGSTFQGLNGWGGNKVLLAPGSHDLTIQRTTKFNLTLTQKSWPLTYVFVAGRQYEVGPENRFNPFETTLVLKDKSTKAIVWRSDESMQADYSQPGALR